MCARLWVVASSHDLGLHALAHHPGKFIYLLACRVSLGHHVRTRRRHEDLPRELARCVCVCGVASATFEHQSVRELSSSFFLR